MGVYSYGIYGTKVLPEIGEVSKFRFRFKRHWYYQSDVERQSRADAQWIKRHEGKTFPKLAVQDKDDALYIWVSKEVIGDDDYGFRPLSLGTLPLLTDEEQSQLWYDAPWVGYALSSLSRREIPYVPTTRKRYYQLINEGIDQRLAQRAVLSA